MTVEYWLTKITELVVKQGKSLSAGEITASEADREEEELVMQARLDLTDEEGAELLRRLLAAHQTIADNMALRGRPASGNDPKKPN